MSGDPFNFEPAYAALASLLVSSATQTLSATAALGSPVLTGIDTSKLVSGLAAIANAVPVGTQILSVDSPSQVTLTQPLTQNGVVSIAFGYATIDPMAARLLRHWSDVPSSEQPALFLSEIDEVATKRIGQPQNWTLNVKAYVYCQSPAKDTPVAPALNALLSALRRAVSKDSTGPGAVQNRQTLGGAVLDAYISGRIEKDEGFLGQQGVAIVPIAIVANGP